MQIFNFVQNWNCHSNSLQSVQDSFVIERVNVVLVGGETGSGQTLNTVRWHIQYYTHTFIHCDGLEVNGREADWQSIIILRCEIIVAVKQHQRPEDTDVVNSEVSLGLYLKPCVAPRCRFILGRSRESIKCPVVLSR